MNESAASSEGARIGISAMLRHSPLAGIRVRWIAYANANASGIVMSVVRHANVSVLSVEQAGKIAQAVRQQGG